MFSVEACGVVGNDSDVYGVDNLKVIEPPVLPIQSFEKQFVQHCCEGG